MKDQRIIVNRREVIKSLAAAGAISCSLADRALAAGSVAPVRVLLVGLQHGWGISGTSNRFMSGGESEFAFPDGLDPFNSIREHCNVVDGVLTLGLWGNNHDLSYSDIFTAGVAMHTDSSAYDSHMPLSTTPSLDYLLQEASGKATFRMSAGYRSWGVKYHPLSFDNNSTVLPFFTRASDAYASLFEHLEGQAQNAGSGNADAEVAYLNALFDAVAAPAEQMQASVPNAEQDKVRRYLSAVEHVRGKFAVSAGVSGTQKLSHVPASSQSHKENLESYLEMIKVGFANNMTTSAVLGIGDIDGIADFHHTHAHSNSDIWWDSRRNFAQSIVNFANGLAAITDFDGRSLLDNTIIVLSGEVGDGGHNVINKGQIVIGGGAHIPVGRYLKQDVVSGRDNIRALMREDIDGNLVPQLTFGNQHTQMAGTRTHADLLREVGNVAGLNLMEFGLPSQNKGAVLL